MLSFAHAVFKLAIHCLSICQHVLVQGIDRMWVALCMVHVWLKRGLFMEQYASSRVLFLIFTLSI